ncbi:MAG TPA: alpha/beta fold hydrolase [Planctomycetota bacterium]|nr:alpha/beta fold hydrolase [Planctomycetota bacterium]
MGVAKHATRVRCADGLQMGLDVYVPEGETRPLPVAVVCHGFKGFKDWGCFPPLAERLAGSGRAVALFDFSHNGVGEAGGCVAGGEFTRLDLFGAQTISRHVADLGAILDALDGGAFAEQANLQRNRHFNVVGHSLGAAVAMLRAADDARIVQLATLNGTASLDRFTPDHAQELAATGQVLVRNTRTGQDMPLGRAWFDDVARLDLESAATQIFVPALVIAGDADVSVPLQESRTINGWIAGSRLVVIPGGDHVFGARHPFAGWTPALTAACRELDAFLPHVGRLGGI